MTWRNRLKGDSISWLLEESSPGVRYLALRDLMDESTDSVGLKSARKTAHQKGPIASILDEMEADGFWVEPGAGYYPKYRGTVWALILLAQLGASADQDERIAKACEYVLSNTLTTRGRFSIKGGPSATADCLQGNMCAALVDLGWQDERLDEAYEWMARSVTGEGVAPQSDKKAELRYYAGKCGPDFVCGANNKLACAWGAVKVMQAFGKLSVEQRTPLIERAIERGVDFLFSVDPATGAYPHGYAEKPSGNWWKFGFPVFYITDFLQNAAALVRLGYGKDSRLKNTLDLVREKQDEQGRWVLEYHYTGKTWLDFGERKEPNKWVTLRALRVLKQADM
jgi:hypothetical protein